MREALDEAQWWALYAPFGRVLPLAYTAEERRPSRIETAAR
jgi:hypothetical protein